MKKFDDFLWGLEQFKSLTVVRCGVDVDPETYQKERSFDFKMCYFVQLKGKILTKCPLFHELQAHNWFSDNGNTWFYSE